MSVAVEALDELERFLEVSIPVPEISFKVESKLAELAKTAEIRGFRKGKIPLNIVKKYYLDKSFNDAAHTFISERVSNLVQNCKVAGQPKVEITQCSYGQDLNFKIVYEVLPEISPLTLSNKDTFELFSCTVSEDDVDEMIKRLQTQFASFDEVTSAAAEGDKVVIDFVGYIDGKPFANGTAHDYSLELGSKSFIPGFEEQLIGAKAESKVTVNVKFPDDYGSKDLAGSDARFDVVVHKVLAKILPELTNDKIKEIFGMDDMDTLRRDLRRNMEVMASFKVNKKNASVVFAAYAQKHDFPLPKALIEQEIDELNHQLYHHISGAHHKDSEKIPQYPRELFATKAQDLVKQKLLLDAYVQQHNVVPNAADIDDVIEKISYHYQDPKIAREYYRNDKKELAKARAIAFEFKIMQSIIDKATVSYSDIKYFDIHGES